MPTPVVLDFHSVANPVVATLGAGSESAYVEVARFAPTTAGLVMMQLDVAGNALGGLKFTRNAAPGGATVSLVADAKIEGSSFVLETVNDGTHPCYQTAAGASCQVLLAFRSGAELIVLAKRADNSAIATVTITAALVSGRSTPQWLGASMAGSVPGPFAVGGLTTFNGGIAMGDGQSIAGGTGTGTQIGTAAAQKFGFFGAAPVVQPASPTGNTATGAAGSGTGVFLNTTLTGGVGSTAYTSGDVVKALKAVGLLAQ